MTEESGELEIDQGCAEVRLAWDQSTDVSTPQSAIEYEVYVNGVLSPLGVDSGVRRSFAYGTNHLNHFVVQRHRDGGALALLTR